MESATDHPNAKGLASERWLAAATIIAVPLVTTVETAVRHLFHFEGLETLRDLLRQSCTTAAWVVVPVAVLLAALGATIHGALLRRALLPIPEDATRRRQSAKVGAFFLASSVLQIPGLAAAILFLLGAAFLPVAIVMAVVTLGIVALLRRR